MGVIKVADQRAAVDKDDQFHQDDCVHSVEANCAVRDGSTWAS